MVCTGQAREIAGQALALGRPDTDWANLIERATGRKFRQREFPMFIALRQIMSIVHPRHLLFPDRIASRPALSGMASRPAGALRRLICGGRRFLTLARFCGRNVLPQSESQTRSEERRVGKERNSRCQPMM